MLKEVLSDKTNIEKLFALNKPRIEHFTKIGQNLSKQIVISNLRDDKGTFKIHKEARQKIRLIEIDLLSSAQEEYEISNMTNPEILVDTLLTSMLGNIVLWVIKPDNTDSLIDKIEKDAKIILGVIDK